MESAKPPLPSSPWVLPTTCSQMADQHCAGDTHSFRFFCTKHAADQCSCAILAVWMLLVQWKEMRMHLTKNAGDMTRRIIQCSPILNNISQCWPYHYWWLLTWMSAGQFCGNKAWIVDADCSWHISMTGVTYQQECWPMIVMVTRIIHTAYLVCWSMLAEQDATPTSSMIPRSMPSAIMLRTTMLLARMLVVIANSTCDMDACWLIQNVAVNADKRGDWDGAAWCWPTLVIGDGD